MPWLRPQHRCHPKLGLGWPVLWQFHPGDVLAIMAYFVVQDMGEPGKGEGIKF